MTESQLQNLRLDYVETHSFLFRAWERLLTTPMTLEQVAKARESLAAARNAITKTAEALDALQAAYLAQGGE